MAFLYQLIVNILWSLNFLCTWKILRILNYFNKYWDLFPNFQSDFQTQCSRLTHKDDGTLNSQRVEFCGFYFTATYTFVLMEKNSRIFEWGLHVSPALHYFLFFLGQVRTNLFCSKLLLAKMVSFLNILICKICVKVGKLNIIHPVMLASFSPVPWWSSIIKWWPKSWETMQCSKIHSTKDFNLSFQFKTTFKSAIAALEPSHVRENHSKLG